MMKFTVLSACALCGGLNLASAAQSDCRWREDFSTSAKGCFYGNFLPPEGGGPTSSLIQKKLHLLITFTFDGPHHQNVESVWKRVSTRDSSLMWKTLQSELRVMSILPTTESILLWSTGSAHLSLSEDELTYIVQSALDLIPAEEIQVSFLTISGGYDGFRKTLKTNPNFAVSLGQLTAPVSFESLLFFDSFFDSGQYLNDLIQFSSGKGFNCRGYYSQNFLKSAKNGPIFEKKLEGCQFKKRTAHINFSKISPWWLPVDAQISPATQ